MRPVNQLCCDFNKQPGFLMKTILTLAAAGLLATAATLHAENFMPFGGDDSNSNWYNDGSGYGYGDGSGRGRGSGEFNMNFSGRTDMDAETDHARNFSGNSNNRFYNNNAPYGYGPYGYGAPAPMPPAPYGYGAPVPMPPAPYGYGAPAPAPAPR